MTERAATLFLSRDRFALRVTEIGGAGAAIFVDGEIGAGLAAALAAALREAGLSAGAPARFDVLLSAVDGLAVPLGVPLREERRIRAVLPALLEPLVPRGDVGAWEVRFGALDCGGSAGGSAKRCVLACAFPRLRLKELLLALRNAGIEPDSVRAFAEGAIAGLLAGGDAQDGVHVVFTPGEAALARIRAEKCLSFRTLRFPKAPSLAWLLREAGRMLDVAQKGDATAQADDYRYDSRSNLVAHADAQGPVTTRTINRRGLGSSAAVTVNDSGNVSIFFFDGISRQVKTEQILTASGDGDGTNIGATLEGVKTTTPTPDTAQGGGDGKIRVGYVWDDNSLLQALLDDQGNVTAYLYDNLNRRVVETKGLTTFSTATTFTRTNFFVPSVPPPGPPATERKVFTPTVPTQDAPGVIPDARIDAQIAQVRSGVDAVATDFPSIADRRDEVPPTSIIYGYDRDDKLLILEDENDSEVFSRFDGISRRIAVRVFRAGQTDSHAGDPVFAPAPSAAFLDRRNPAQYNQQTDPVVGTHKNDSEFDGLSRLTRATDNNEPGDSSDDSEVRLFYDSLSRLFEENQKLGTGPTHVVSSGWRADDLRLSLVYPSSGSMQRKVLHTFDALDRLKDVKDDGAATPIATYSYIGKWRVEKRFMQNGVDLTVPYDGVRRPRRWEHKHGTTLKIGFGYEFASGKPAYNRTNNKLIEEKLHDPGNSESYAYDSVYRIGKPGVGNGFERGTLNGAKTAVATLTTTPGVQQMEDWNLDGVGNWSDETFQFQGGAATTDDRSHTSINEFYRSTIAATTLDITHDDNGNVLDDDTKAHTHIGKPKLRRRWDYRNLLREVLNKDTGATLGVYTYDGLIRRAKKNAGGTITVFLLDGNREIQERNGSGVITQEYPFGVYIDEPLALDRNLNGDDSAIGAGDQRLVYHQNTLYSVFGLTDTTGGVVEGYLYDAYGRPYVIMDGDDGDAYVNFVGNDVVTKRGTSAVGNSFLYTGRRYDAEVSGQYYYRARFYDFEIGRFASRDPIQRHPDSTRFPTLAWRPYRSFFAHEGFALLQRREGGIHGRSETLPVYAYADSNPVMFVDPHGEFVLCTCSLLPPLIGGPCAPPWAIWTVTWGPWWCTPRATVCGPICGAFRCGAMDVYECRFRRAMGAWWWTRLSSTRTGFCP